MIFVRSNVVRCPAPDEDALHAKWCDDVLRASPIKHAKHQSFASIIGFQSIAPFVSEIRSPDRLGVVVAGGTQHIGVAWRFVERAFRAGSSMVNPISFPATLTSAVPASIAAAVGAHAFALTIGYDHRALFEAIDRSCLMVRRDYADDVFVVACTDRRPHPTEAWDETERPSAQEIAVGFHLSRFRSAGRCILKSFGSGSENAPEQTARRICDEHGMQLSHAMREVEVQGDAISIYSPDGTYRVDLMKTDKIEDAA
ncbi:hypothetical protein [Methylocystis hirsuta]|uniref:Beta-ketoacyl synthase N-terminal domain-containing protein n=1 Tax=Methylocystis hirsuta TaxID=369798 RepID=A0A3M9XPY0_9HYPH|nr:hypothetical protein [Methylocystis hirsuta]RNJ50367.1 hypothetical protein D1O30_12965 [Methylocystis hirsuta]